MKDRIRAAFGVFAAAVLLTACSGGGGDAKPRTDAGNNATASAASADRAPDGGTAPAPPSVTPSAAPSSSPPPEKVNKVTIQPSKGTTVGIGMPVSLKFDFPITTKEAKAAVERGLTVTTSPHVEGSWGWVRDELGYDRVDWRPRDYWAPGTRVTLDAKLDGVNTGDDRYLVRDYQTEFTIGAARTSVVDLTEHTMTVSENGRVAKTIPISAGQPGNDTWTGTMLVLEKQRQVQMDSETVGLGNAYNKPVFWDVRLTTSGTFVHAAPWNSAYLGKDNKSHGCVGMSDADAEWFFERATLGDVVKVTGNAKSVELGNGFGLWSVDYATWAARSSLT